MERLQLRICALIATLLLMLTVSMVGRSTAKSLYLIADINRSPTPIQAWDIQATKLVFQAEHLVPYHGIGAVGLAFARDPEDPLSGFLFVTYESSDVIELINAKNMQSEGSTQAPGASNLAGIVVDQGKSKVYTVDRWTNNLYVYAWDAASKTLTLDGVQQLANLQGAFGVALDETNGILYVADLPGGDVDYYNTNDWTYVASFTPSHAPISVAVDVGHSFVYTGAGWGGSTLLSRWDLSSSTETTLDLAPAGVMGIAVDPQTGLSYVTTGYTGDEVRVFDLALEETFRSADLGNPTGLVVGVGFNPLSLQKDDGLQEGDCVDAGAKITYTICFDNEDNLFDVHNVKMMDNLPAETEFESVSNGGAYDPETHTVTWDIGTLEAGAAQQCVKLVVKVVGATSPETIILNNCTIETDETSPTTQPEDTQVCAEKCIGEAYAWDGGYERVTPETQFKPWMGLWVYNRCDEQVELGIPGLGQPGVAAGKTPPSHTFRGGTQVEDYHLASVPGIPDDPRPSRVFRGGIVPSSATLGTRQAEDDCDPTQFRIWWYDPAISDYLGCDQAPLVEPRYGYWYITRQDRRITLLGTLPNPNKDYWIVIHPGKNMIGFPFLQGVRWGDVMERPLGRENVLKDGGGRPLTASAGPTGISFTLKHKRYRDRTLFLGMHPQASKGLDSMDWLAPPPVSNQVPRIYVDHSDWKQRPGLYAVDVRPLGKGRLAFPVTVKLPKKILKRCKLSWKGVRDIPSRLKVTLLDEEKGRSVDMRRKRRYKIKPRKKATHYELKVLIE